MQKCLFIKDLSLSEQEVCTSASWQYADSKLILTVYYIETPYVVDYTLSFSGKKLNCICIGIFPWRIEKT